MDWKDTPTAITGAIAVAALLFSSLGSKNSAKQPSQSSGKAATVSEAEPHHSPSGGTTEALSRDDRGPWYAFCQEFSGDAGAAGPVTEQLEELERVTQDQAAQHKFAVHQQPADSLKNCRTSSAALEFLVATLPDPIGSHLDIEFDRALESLLRAAAVRRYTFERYWLPWRPPQSATVSENTSQTAARSEERLRQEQPGLLIFRKLPDPNSNDPQGRDQFLLIFLVGETPTAGLNRPAFLRSLRYIEELSSAKQPEISIAGPIFSSSLPSLGDAIFQYSSAFPAANKPVFHVVNYGARSSQLITAFKKTLLSPPMTPASTFSSLDLNVWDAQAEWVHYLCDLGYKTNEMAALAESGSAYGNTVLADQQSSQKQGKAECDIGSFQSQGLFLNFPRDLSSIRNATDIEGYAAEPEQIAGINIPSIGVALTLRQDETNEHDAPPDFAQNQSSARVDRALRAMVKALRLRRIQAVLVTATNPLDRVFLLEYLHLTVPDVRLATVGADDFMLARPKLIDLSGTLAITSLPLTENVVSVASAEGKPKTLSINFSSNASEGIFLAAANLLGPGPKLATDADPRGCADISIVGKTGFRPAMVQGKARLYPCLSGTTVGRSASATSPASVFIGRHKTEGNPAPLIWILALISLLVASTAHLLLVCSSNGWLGLRFLIKVPRFALSSSSVREGQLLFLLIATCQILLLEWLAVTTTFALQAEMPGYQQTLNAAHRLLLVASLLLCGWLVLKAMVKTSRVVRAGTLASLAFVVLTALSWWRLLFRSTQPQLELGRLVAVRAVYFLEGLSPLLPVFFLLLAYYLWSLNNLHRLSMVVARVSLDIPKDNDSASQMADMVNALQMSISRVLNLKPRSLALMTLALIACCMVRLPSALRGFDSKWLGWLVTCEFVILLLIIVSTFHRSWDVWLQLKRILHFLDTALLGDAFPQVPKELSSMRIWSFAGDRASVMVQVRTAELLQRMAKSFPPQAAQAAAAGASITSSLTSKEVSASHRSGASAFPELRKLARLLDTKSVVPRSLATNVSALLNERMPDASFLFDPDAAAKSDLAPEQKNLLELYLAYRFVALFRYVMRQLRNMLTFVIYGFACLVLATSTYPFQGRQSLGNLMSMVFVLLLLGVAAMMIQMYRDPVLKRLEEPSSGLSNTFEVAFKLIGVAGVPLFAVLASQFPSLAEALLNWFRPLVEASH